MVTPTDLMYNKLLEIINQIQSQIVNHSQDTFILMTQSICLDGIGNIIAGMICMFFGFLSIKFLLSSYKEPYKGENKLITIMSIIAIPATIFTGLLNLSYWNWIKIFNPKIYLVHEIMNKVLTINQ